MSYIDADAVLEAATEAAAADEVPWPLLEGSCKLPSE
jgi:hypothetical protein